MKISIGVTNYSWRSGPAELGRIARAADEAGIDTIWVPDHLIQADPTAPQADRDMYEAYTVLGYLAGQTERVRLGAMVSSVTMRPPALLINAVGTVDALSGGRAWLGVGAGYHADESNALGLSLPPVAERFERMEEMLQIAIQMWGGDDKPFEGRHYRLTRPVTAPLPTRRPRILIGGTGERRTLRLVAQYADACNVFDIPDEGQTVRHKLDVLQRHCADVGRPYDEIEKTLSTRLSDGESGDDFLRRCETAAEWGIRHMIVGSSEPWGTAALAILGDAIERSA